MSPVFGVVNRDGGEVTSVTHSMMNKLERSRYDKSWTISNRSLKAWNSDIESTYGQVLGKISFVTKESPEAPAFDCSRSLAVLYEGNLYNMRELMADLVTKHNIRLGSASEVVAHLLEERYQGDLSLAVKQIVPVLDGAYFLAASDGTQTVTIRDAAGLRPAFYAKRMHNLKKVGVLISGGVDSCLMTKLVAEAAAEGGIQVTTYTAGLNGTDDIEYAEQFARELGLKHRVRRISLDEIESHIPKVARTVEERDMVQIEAGIGIYAALEVASQDDIHAVFSGQGPDELWGGYTWYPKVIAAEGYEGLQRRMWDDLQRGDIETFDRENKIALAHGSEQLFPYCDTEMIRLAMSVSPRLKIKSAEDSMGKHPHREAAIRFGVPEEFAYRAKNAAQHGTGVHDTLDAIARKNGFTPELAANVGYNSEEVCREKLASSTRYGYRYANRELWQVPGHIQFFLDSVAYKNGLLNKNERSAIS